MATILLNGVETDASSISGSDLNDKLTVSGGVDGLSVDLAEGDDRVEMYADSENIANAEIRVSDGDDVISVVANDGAQNNADDATEFVGDSVSLGDSLLGGPGEDVIMLEDGLVQLSGAVKGNEDDDTIHVANISGGTVNGNAGDDTIRIGEFAVEEAGSQAANAVTNGSVMGGQGDDTITIDADVTDSAIRGNEGDDIITFEGGDVSGATTINGNDGNDTIDASEVEGDLTVIGGKGDDTLIAGNGQTVRGNLGADTFVVGASGGVFIDDFDKLDLDGDGDVDDPDCFCDDEIQLQNITFETHTYDVERVKFTSASSWTGDIKVKAVADGAAAGDTARVTLQATKTETVTAKAVARLFITETKTSLALVNGNLQNYQTGLEAALPAVKYDATDLDVAKGFGVTKSGSVFDNGLADGGIVNANGAIVGSGIGAAYGQATGYWTQTTTRNGNARTAIGAIRNVVVATTNQFEKGDFSFLQLTATEKVGVETNQKLVFSDVTNATVKNHYADYNKVKETNTNNLYTMNFGTANFNTVTTGRAYMVVTKGIEDKAYKTTTLDVTGANATAKVTLDLNDYFYAWKRVDTDPLKTANPTPNATNPTSRTEDGKFSWSQILYTGIGRAVTPNSEFAKYSNGNGFIDSKYVTYTNLQDRGEFTLTTTARNTAQAATNSSLNTINNAVTRNGVTRFVGANQATNANQVGLPLAINANNTTVRFTTFTGNKNLYAQAVTGKGGVSLVAGINNTARTKDDFVTNTGRLVMKIAVSETATAKASKALGTLVERTTIFGEELTITTCPDFPSVSSLETRIVDGQARHGDVTGDFNNRYLWADRTNDIRSVANGRSVLQNGADPSYSFPTNATVLKSILAPGYAQVETVTLNNGNVVTRVVDSNAQAGEGFFSAASFTPEALEAQGFGDVATRIAASDDAKNVPFRVLFFDNDATSNGLYIMSGLANYNDGELTALNTNPTTSSEWGGNHTIVKVTGGKGSVIELSDINLV